MSSIMKGLVDEQDIEETKKLSAQEKFKRSMARAGYDMDAGAKRLQDLLDKQKKEREELEKKETKDVSEDATLQFAAEITPTVSPYAGIKDRQFRGAIGEGIKRMFEEPNYSPTDAGYQQGGWRKMNEQDLDEDLRKWFKEKWVRFGPDGKIRGACARGDDSEGKPKCLPQAKAHALGKKGRKYAAAKKRREDPNPERSGPAKNVATKKKSNESLIEFAPNFRDDGDGDSRDIDRLREEIYSLLMKKLANVEGDPQDIAIAAMEVADDIASESALVDFTKLPNWVEMVKNKIKGVAEGLINEKIAEGIVYATGPRSHGINDVDLIFKNLRTKKIVASVLGNNDHGIYEIKIDQNGLKPQSPINFVATGNPQDGSGEHVVYKLSSNRGNDAKEFSTMRNGFDTRNNTYYGMKMDFIGDDDYWSFLENMIGDIMWEDDAIEAGYVDRLDNGDLVFVKNQGVAEGLDNVPSTLYHATYRPLLKSIKQHGLGGDKAQSKWEDSKPGVVYLAVDKNVAESYAETSDVVPDDWIDKIIILKISTAGLDSNKFNIDSNVQDNEGDTLEYHGIIPVSNIKIVKQGVAETSDYFRRREREEGIISGKRPARKKAPAQTSDYAKRREQEKKAEQGVSEGSDLPPKVIEMIKKIAQSSASPEHKKAAIDALVAKYSKQGVAEGFSDISGLLYANNLNKSFIITAELAEGGKKKFRVKAQNERVAMEKFKKHHSMAKIINVKEEGVEEGSKYPRNPASYHLKKYPVPQEQLARPVKKEKDKLDKKPEQKPEEKLDELKCWPGYSRVKGVPAGAPGSCKKKTNEDYQQCPECGGAMYEVSLMNEKKDACYYKVKSRYKVWPSAYASGALVKCRKKGAKNWGTKTEGQIYSTGGGAGEAQRWYRPKDNLGETSSNILAGILKAKE